MRQNPRAQAHGDAFRAEHERERQFAGQCDRLFVSAIIAGNEFSDFVVENFRAREFGQTAFDITRRGGRIARINIAKISLAFDEITFVCQHHERVANGSIAVRMILHRMADNIGHFDETSVILVMQRPKDAPLHRFQAVRQIRNRAVADDIAGVFEKSAVHARVQANRAFFGIKRFWRRNILDRLSNDMLCAISISVSADFGGLFRLSVVRYALDRQFRLVRIFFTFC